jgi:hypothetical protein
MTDGMQYVTGVTLYRTVVAAGVTLSPSLSVVVWNIITNLSKCGTLGWPPCYSSGVLSSLTPFAHPARFQLQSGLTCAVAVTQPQASRISLQVLTHACGRPSTARCAARIA